MAIADRFTPDRQDGDAAAAPVRFQELTGDGAITIAQGVVVLSKGTAAAVTIDNPPAGMNGAELTVLSTTAAAHTLTYTPGFGGGATSRDVATFGGAIDDNIVLVAWNGVWHVKSTRNVTLS